jgi:hypothetical protein
MQIKPLNWREYDNRGVIQYTAEIRDFNIRFYHVENNTWFYEWSAGEWGGHYDCDAQFIHDDLNYAKMMARCQEEYEKWLKHAYAIE